LFGETNPGGRFLGWGGCFLGVRSKTPRSPKGTEGAWKEKSRRPRSKSLKRPRKKGTASNGGGNVRRKRRKRVRER